MILKLVVEDVVFVILFFWFDGMVLDIILLAFVVKSWFISSISFVY